MPKPYNITALDIGSGSVKLVSVLKRRGDSDFEILGYLEEPSLGIRRGVVINASQVSDTISSLVRKLEDKSKKKIGGIYANIGGGHINSVCSRGLVSVSRADQKISREDIYRVIQAAQTFPLPSNKEIIEVFPKDFIVDGGNSIKEAVGMQGVRLEADVLAICGFSPYLNNLKKSILTSGLEINCLIPTPLASSKAVLTPREKELGVCVLDIGSGTSSMSVFEEGSLIHTAVFPVGSGHITNDIAVCLKTDIDTAEKIKIEFGALRESGASEKRNRKNEKKIKIEGEDNVSFSKKTLNDIIEARVSEIFDLTNKELKKISKQGQLPAGVVLTGGGAKILGIRDFAKKELKLPIRIGTPVFLSEEKGRHQVFGLSDDPGHSTLYGLLIEAIEMEEDDIRDSGGGGGFWHKAKSLLRVFIP
ncbi:MAG: cell division protein FtsA [Candidatus Pacebacteria bacterium]|nr:cell division protein FtsA [Candidatus Paceibacterota bacterium]